MKTIDLSIIVVNFNTKDLLIDCLKSIHETDSTLNLEIIVVDNGSSESVTKDLRNLKIPYLHLIENKDNLGFAKANNQGIRVAKGKYQLLLNSDTIVKKMALEKLYNFAETQRDLGVVGARLLNSDGSIQASVFKFPTIINAIKQYFFQSGNYFDKYYPNNDGAVMVEAVVGAAFLITKEALNRVGLLDERYFMYFEDLAYCRNVWKSGLSVYYLPEAEIVHYHGMSGKKSIVSKDAWKKLIPGSIIYHGLVKHWLLTIVLWLGQKWQTLLRK